MKLLQYVSMIYVSLLFIGCSPDKNTQTKLFEDQRKALDKAKAIEAVVQQQNQQVQQNLDSQTR